MLIDTPRTLLRPFRMLDADEAFAFYGDPHVMRYIGRGSAQINPKQKHEAMIRRMRMHAANPDRSVLAIVERNSHKVIGHAGLIETEIDGTNEVELVYLLRANMWDRGLATEVAQSLIEDAFGRQRLGRLVAITHLENKRSQRVLEKCGFVRRKGILHFDIPMDFYALERLDARHPGESLSVRAARHEKSKGPRCSSM
jgi:RimJ/RimL family protein N-acetyltransferase